MIKLNLPDKSIRKYAVGQSLLEISKEFADLYQSPIVEGVFNGIGIDLQKPLQEDGKVTFIERDSEEGMRVYIRSLVFLFLVAIKDLRPEVKIAIRNSLGSALYCEITNDIALSKYDLKSLEDYMKQLVQESAPITYSQITKREAAKLLSEHHEFERLELLKDISDEQMLNIYSLHGHKEYFFGPMLPDVSSLRLFELLNYEGGIVINYPEPGKMNEMDSFVPSSNLHNMFEEMEAWSKMIQCNTVAQLNRIIEEDRINAIIYISEALHEKKVAAIADKIVSSHKKIRLVLIAGPSSSGKTTFSQRLSIQMVVNGIKPIPISMDDYYKERKDTPRKEDGTYDFECVEAIDLELFNDHLQRLLAGEKVKVPKYNFRSGLREYRGREITLEEHSVLVIEGIHGLNELLTVAVPAENKIKIYVSALTPMSLDNYNRIQTTDMRLLRRMVRDSQFRSHDASTTLELWSDVRRGEKMYIFPFQEEADIIFNTTLIYEFGVLKKYAEPLLKAVQENEPGYTNAQRLLSLLSHIKEIDKELIPKNSILREFVGGSAFKDAL